MTRTHHIQIAATIVAAASLLAAPAFAQSSGDRPETVMITLHAKPGAAAALADAIARHYDTARRLNLLQSDAPHLTLRTAANGKETSYVEILTWRDASVPDNAPPEILAIWKELNALVEPRGGRPGLDIVEVTPVTSDR
jgi:hypothetical protein